MKSLKQIINEADEQYHSKIVSTLRKLGNQENENNDEFEKVVSSLDKTNSHKIAGAYTGAGERAYKSHKAAIDAIRSKYRESRYQISKSKVNKNVTPW